MEKPESPPENATPDIIQLHEEAMRSYEQAVMVQREYMNARSNALQSKQEYDRAVRELLQARLF